MDISEFQGKIDWKKVKSSYIQGAIIRIGYTGSVTKKNAEDTRFSEYIKGATTYNIPIGIYYYGYCSTEKSAIKEANFVIETLKKYKSPKLTYPIFYDAEVSKIGKANY